MAKLYLDALDPGVETDRRVGDAMVDLCGWERTEDEERFIYRHPQDEFVYEDMLVYKDERKHFPSQPDSHWVPSRHLKDAWFVIQELVDGPVERIALELGVKSINAPRVEIVIGDGDLTKNHILAGRRFQEAFTLCRAVLWAHDYLCEHDTAEEQSNAR